jgi:hypothetical protein
MKRERFQKSMQRPPRTVKAGKHVTEALDHPDVLEIIERHQNAVDQHNRQRPKRFRRPLSQ